MDIDEELYEQLKTIFKARMGRDGEKYFNLIYLLLQRGKFTQSSPEQRDIEIVNMYVDNDGNLIVVNKEV